jgi:hypothetical protein
MSFNMLPGLLGGNYGMMPPGQQPMPPMHRPMPALQPQAQQTMGGRVGGLFGDFMTRFRDMQQNNPQALMALASGMMAGDVGVGMAGAGDAMAQYREKMAGQQEQQRQNSLTKRYLLSKGISEEEADAAAANPAILSELLKRAGGGGEPEYGLTPVYGTDPETKQPVLGVIGRNGTFKKIDTGGFDISTGVEKIDLGDRVGYRDKRSGQWLGTEMKGGTPSADQRPDAVGGGLEAIPGSTLDRQRTGEGQAILERAARAKTQVAQLESHPGLSEIFGRWNQHRPGMLMSDQGRDALTRFEQLKGTVFLEGYQMLKGGGAITDTEGLKAENALARMDRAVSVEDFKIALRDFIDAVESGARKLAYQPRETIPAPGAPGADVSDPLGIRR